MLAMNGSNILSGLYFWIMNHLAIEIKWELQNELIIIMMPCDKVMTVNYSNRH